MTGAAPLAAGDDDPLGAHTPGGLSGYRAFFRVRSRRTLFTAGIVGRAPLALVGFSVLFFVQAATGSYAVAGFASGVATGAMAVVSPVFGRIADRRGQRGPLLIAAIAHPIAVALLIVFGSLHLPLPAIGVGSVLVGGTIAPVGAFMRARWPHLVGRGASLQVAFSIEAIADELVWVFGPALAALVAGLVHPAAGLVLSGVMGVVGSLWLRRGGDVTVPSALRPGPQEHGDPAAPGSAPARHVFRPWRSRRVMALLLANAAMGLAFGINDVTVVAWTTSIGKAEIAGLVLTAYSIGSTSGGFLMGLVPARIAPYRLLVGSATVFGIFWSLLVQSPDPYWLFPLGVLAGATITPMTISTNRVVHDEVNPAVFTEALAWISASIAGAMALGNFLGGVVDQAQGPSAGFGVVAYLAPVPFVVVAAIGLTLRRRARVEAA
ncbi:MFS transporter [Frondihabitans australicus]|uniref:Putative MFS family arabinose efflux permease n=1 Tax=Frondihabitans australicus TaxID=386892 RepID=A0A495IHV3_9MICO|nr:MFS transporter [Frondihabitans australicus]RKR75612.1 putative MFS family arabinose efflux permease [Frondihabitans australicus]